MQYAVIETGGKQYKVTPGMTLTVDSLGANEGENVKFDKVLLFVDEGKSMIGTPYVSGVTISATVVTNGKGPKVRVAKFLAKSRYRRVMGYRAGISTVQIEGFGSGSKKEKIETKEAAIEVEKPKKSAPKKASSVKKTSKKA